MEHGGGLTNAAFMIEQTYNGCYKKIKLKTGRKAVTILIDSA
jgi:hypothetical protein